MSEIRLYGGPWHGRVLHPDREMPSFVVPAGRETVEYVPREYEVSWQRRPTGGRERLATVTRYVCGDPRPHETEVMQELLLGMTAALLLTAHRAGTSIPLSWMLMREAAGRPW